MMSKMVNRFQKPWFLPKPRFRYLAIIALLLGFGLFKGVSLISAQAGSGYIFDVREIETTELGLPNPVGLTFSPAANLLLAVDDQEKGKRDLEIAMINLRESSDGSSTLMRSSPDLLINMAFNGANNSLFLINGPDQRLDQVPLGPDGRPAPAAKVSASYNIKAYGAQNFEGMAFDPEDGRLFLLDPAGKRMIIVTPDENGSYDGNRANQEAQIDRIDLKHLGAKHLRGIAFNPGNAHLYVLDPDGKKLFEISDSGQLYDTRDLSPYALRDPQGMVFAPSGDNTDDPEIMSLYIADSGQSKDLTPRPGEIIEFSLEPPYIQP